ncbi:uncharacterized protein LOC119685338 [Teleopsis dalmanni]|uniref:uncharacterized protein LOC119685338 n=1 Tax=Teleopsis dalmanni TaxID=139649 RepID=UPI0018CCD7FD|nr:uncharacterized protein LOC119685338 [Teleopsis dalmanni]
MKFHDCSSNARCFNLKGTYTCSCREGYSDLSENNIFPGRKCSPEIIGCNKCHYNGICVNSTVTTSAGELLKNQHWIPDSMACECFIWYAGTTCQLNLKIVLISLSAIGAVLFVLFLFCVLHVACSKHARAKTMFRCISQGCGIAQTAGGPRLFSGSYMHDGSSFSGNCAIIKDTSSERSHCSLPYVLRSDSTHVEKYSNKPKKFTVKYKQHDPPIPYEILTSNSLDRTPEFISNGQSISNMEECFSDQTDRSLTVMIPRAKYYSSTKPQGQFLFHQPNIRKNDMKINISKLSNGQKFSSEKKMKLSTGSSKNNFIAADNHGALVSAGFEVSAVVGHNLNNSSSDKNDGMDDISNAQMYFNAEHQNYFSKQSESTEVRSFNETIVQGYNRLIHNFENETLDEANTMAERDVGSTFLLPHTHLYKLDIQESEISGHESF